MPKTENKRDAIILVLKKKWYDLIDAGVKTEEYRAASAYWMRRFAAGNGIGVWFDKVEFRNGYRADARRMRFNVRGCFLTERHWHPEWGEPTGAHLVISLGSRIRRADGIKGDCL